MCSQLGDRTNVLINCQRSSADNLSARSSSSRKFMVIISNRERWIIRIRQLAMQQDYYSVSPFAACGIDSINALNTLLTDSGVVKN